MSIKESVTLVAGEPVAAVKCRVLMGWLPEQEAIGLLLGGRLPAPNEDVTKQKADFEKAKAAIGRRTVFKAEAAVIED